MEHKKCQVKRPEECKTGDHNFIVSRWLLSANQQIGNGFTCTKCLVTYDGRDEIDKIRAAIDERHLQDDSNVSKPVTRGKSSKGSSGETQDT
jgi:hypothetical protein